MPLSTLNEEVKKAGSFLAVHGLLSLILALVALSVVKWDWAVSFVFGEVIIGFSLLSLSLSVYLFFFKKNIALLALAIVLKWPVVIYVVYRVINTIDVDSVAFSLGLFTVFISALIWSQINKA